MNKTKEAKRSRWQKIISILALVTLSALFAAVPAAPVSAAADEWTWMSGDNTVNQTGVYGTQGVPAAGNVPGSRFSSISWTDTPGDLWLFGGVGYDSTGASGRLGDLWRYSPTTDEWTWMSGTNVRNQPGVYGTLGTPVPTNVPGGRSASISWIDAAGDLWLFGGYGYDSAGSQSPLNDLWHYSSTTGQWTWMSGANIVNQPGVYGTQEVPAAENVPGARYGSTSWIDAAGDLWLFGGYGYDSAGSLGRLNDLWRHNTVTGLWTWMSGANTVSQIGVYGTQGVEAAGNVPGARNYSTSWIDAAGDLWLFGGYGYAASGSGPLNDLWRYSTATGQWTWMSGANTVGQWGAYGTQGVEAAGNVPGARYGDISWIDAAGDLWLLGGRGYDSAGSQGRLNDLWRYSTTTEQWTWMSGDNTVNQPGVYGTLGVPAAGNVPGARYLSISWIDAAGDLWLFGGEGYDSAGSFGYLNGLWRYDPPAPTIEYAWAWMSGANTINQIGVYGTQGDPADENVPGARDGSISWTDAAGDLWLFGGFGYDSTGAVGSLNDLWRYSVAADQWTWMSGANTINQTGVYGTEGEPADVNVPGARYDSISWTDAAGDLWLFGGFGYDSTSNYGCLNDLWRYSAATGQWTWMSGANVVNQNGSYGTQGEPADVNVPGARTASISWIDAAGDLWLFGGAGYDSAGSFGWLNDLWRYSAGTGEWTWMSGANVVNQNGSYGTQGDPALTNVPGARHYSISWIDAAGDLWLFGGAGYDSAGSQDHLNDLWRYSAATGWWTWMSGANVVNQPGVYGTQGEPAAGNVPGARAFSISWIDADGDLWLFGGDGYDTSSSGYLNDLWRYSAATEQWTWMSGDNAVGQLGVYGTQGIPAAGNVPGARESSISWIDAAGDLWLFGGDGYDGAGGFDLLNDLWHYDLPAPTAVTLLAFSAEWAGEQVVVRWETAMEIDTLGFNLWRSTDGGAYERVNATLIPAASLGGVMGGTYEYVDAGVTPGETYSYKLEELEVGGARNWYGPVSAGGESPTAVTLQALVAGQARRHPVVIAIGVTLIAATLGVTVAKRRRRT